LANNLGIVAPMCLVKAIAVSLSLADE